MTTDAIKNEIKDLLAIMGFEKELEGIDIHEGVTNRFSVRLHGVLPLEEEYRQDEDGQKISVSSMLIGERGNNLAALEYLLKRFIYKKYGEDVKFTLDINDYRMRRMEDLKQDVKAAAKEVRTYNKEVPLRPMTSFERRIVHLLLAEYPDIATESIGREPFRKVIIKPYP